VEWVVTTGKTVEEAMEAALDQLGVDEQDAEIEVVQEPQKGLFGRLRAEAQVRARVRPTAPRPKVERRERRRGDRRGRDGDRPRAKKGGARERVGAGAAGGGATPVEASPDDDARNGAADAGAKPSGTRPSAEAGSSSSRRRRRSRGPRTAEGATVTESTQSAERSEEEVELDLEAQRAEVEDFLIDLLAAFGRPDATVSVAVAEDDAALEATVEGTELGLLVGQKGVTLQAVQELVRSMVQRRFVGQAHARVRLDVAGYRARRKVALERFARDVADSVKASGVAKALDPMGSADRKVVHDAVNDIDGVTTVSEGEDAARRVVIRPA
jgi:spoIIIJ-associated protein